MTQQTPPRSPSPASPAKGLPKLPSKAPSMPRGMVGGVRCEVRHADLPPMPVPQRDKVRGFLETTALTKWNDEFTGIVSALQMNDNVITIFGLIGEDYWTGEGTTAKKIASQLKAIGGPVEVQINSPGGDVFEGFAIYNLFRDHPYAVTVKVLGMAASAASVIAMAGDTIQVGAAAFVMIHNCWTVGIGDRNDFREMADFLEPFDQALAALYAARTGEDVTKIAGWMDVETYMSGQMAIDRGFADELLPADQVTVDEQAQTAARGLHDVRATEQMLLASGLSRTQARERINRIKGMPDAALTPEDEGMPDAAEWVGAAGGLLAALQTP